MTNKSPSENLSFFDANKRPLPDNLPVLYDVYLTAEGLILKETPQSQPVLVGDAKPITPANVNNVVIENGRLKLKFNNQPDVDVGSVFRDSVYLDPPLVGSGLRQANGAFTPLVSNVADLDFVETTDRVEVRQTRPITPKSEGYAEAVYRYTGPNQSQAGLIDPPVTTWTRFNLTDIVDSDGIGLTLNAGEFTLPAGLYRVELYATSLRTNVTALRLFCPAISAELMRTPQMYNGRQTDGGVGSIGLVYGVGVFRLTAPRVIQFQYYLSTRGGAGEVRFPWSQHFTAHGAYSEPLKVAIWKCYDANQGSFPTF
jgi:hypothetical protein